MARRATDATGADAGRRANRRGYVERRGKRWYGRIELADKSRPWIPLGSGMSREKALEKLAALVERGDETGQLEAYVGRLRAGMAPRRSRPPTVATTGSSVRELTTDWTSGKLYEQYGAVNRLRPIASAKINAWTLAKHALGVRTRGARGPEFGDLRVAEVTPDDVGKVMAALPRDQAAQSRLHMYQRLRRVFDLAEYPCRLREEGTNPVKRYMRPERDEDKLYCYLYPSEVLALLASAKIPLGRRVLYAVAVYTGLRKGSLYSLRWKGIDFEHGTISALRVKGKRRDGDGGDAGGRPIFSRGDPSLMVLLRAWWIRCGRPEDGNVIREVGLERHHDEAQVLRADLRTVGVTRAILFSDAANVEPLRFHDCRSTFCTWARRAGRSDAWIAERTGHRLSGTMIDRYTRQAQTLEDLDYDAFPDLSVAVAELRPAGARTKPRGRRRPSASAITPPDATSTDPRPVAVAALLRQAASLAAAGHTAASAQLLLDAQSLLPAVDNLCRVEGDTGAIH